MTQGTLRRRFDISYTSLKWWGRLTGSTLETLFLSVSKDFGFKSWTKEGYQTVKGAVKTWAEGDRMYPALLICSHVCQTRTFLIARTAAGKHAAKTELLLNLSVHPTTQSPDSVDRVMLNSGRKDWETQCLSWDFQDQGRHWPQLSRRQECSILWGTRLEGSNRRLVKKGK